MISIVVPTYNRPAMLREALTSVVAQSYSDYEVLVCDDASDRETSEVVQDFAEPRVRYLRADQNQGFMLNSVRGYLAARGEYVTTLHDDDTWEPRLLERLVEPLTERPGLAAAFCDHWVMDAAGVVDTDATGKTSKVYGRSALTPGVVADPTRTLLVDHAVPMIIGTLVRRDAIQWDRVPADVWRIFEMWLLYRLAVGGGGLYYVPGRLANYRRHDNSATARSGVEWHECFAYCWRQLAADPRLAEHRSIFACRAANAEGLRALQLMREGRGSEARSAGRRALSERPTLRNASISAIAHLPAPVSRSLVGKFSSRGKS